jgi:hypothetical protein
MCSIVAFQSIFFLNFYFKFLWKKLASFLNKKKKSQATWSREFFGKFQQKFHTPRKKVMSGFGVVLAFFF